MRQYFEGWYYKHQKGGRTLAFIPGRAGDTAFIQVVTNEGSYRALYPAERYARLAEGGAIVGESLFSPRGIKVNIRADGLVCAGEAVYEGVTPIAGDIMGPFRHLPLQCRHAVVSMRHEIRGSFTLGGRALDLDGGVGYIEGDCGRSFPKEYAWVQCGDFDEPGSVMISAARIPFAGFWFRGCIAVVWHRGEEIRLATYRGARVVRYDAGGIELRQGGYRLSAEVDASLGHRLDAPERGVMTRSVYESPAVPARFRLEREGRVIFCAESRNASFEYVV